MAKPVTASQLFAAADAGHLERLRERAERARSLDVEDSIGVSLLSALCNRDDSRRTVALIEALLEAGADVEYGGSGASRPLAMAAWNGHVRVMRCLLDHRARVNARGEHGRTALHLAANRVRADAVQLLLERGADPNLEDKRDRVTPMHDAMHDRSPAALGRKPSVQERRRRATLLAVLLAAGGDARRRSRLGGSMLGYAGRFDLPEAARVLIAHGARATAAIRELASPRVRRVLVS
jgi:hypothetical protein